MIKRLCWTMMSWLIALISHSTTTTIHVSTSGLDTNSGSDTAPVNTITQAFELSKDNESSDTINILLQEGTYRLTQPIVIDRTTVGSHRHMSISGAGIGKTIISGGIELPPFRAVNDSLWCIDLSGTAFALADIQHLFVNDHRATLARTPNHTRLMSGYRAEQSLLDSVPVRKAERNGLAIHRIKLPESAHNALSSRYGPIERIRISLLHAWDMTRRHIETFNPADTTIFVIGNPQKPWNPIDREAQFFMENDLSFLDEPGEWFYDRDNAKLYYIPLAEEHISTTIATVPLIDSILNINGTPDEHIEDISISDLTFAHSKYDIGRRGDDPVQAAARIGAAISVHNASDIHLTDCEIAHTGNSAIWFGDGCRNSSVIHCHLHDLGAGGIKLGNIARPENEARDLISNITIDNNIIHSGGRVFPTGVGILLMHAADNTISHNDIADFYYTGISAGWIWGYAHSPSKRNLISHNHIHHIGRGVLSDMGGIYTLGQSEGTIVSNNVIHHIYSYTYGGWGLYTDEGSSGITMRDNLVYSCKSSGFHQHYGRGNHITNNIFVNQLHAQLEASLKEDHLSFTFDHNIIYFTGGNMYGINWNSVNSITDHNAYWYCGNGDTTFNGLSLDQWKQATGRDKHSIIADPKFKNPAEFDFTIQNRQLMKRIGFKPFDYKSAGVYGEESWLNRAKIPTYVEEEFDTIVEAYETGTAHE